jgi:hypothetical protein
MVWCDELQPISNGQLRQDLYQNFFGQGLFTGKGIYDLDAFDQILCERIPENQVLSHDIIEGNYACSGLVTDVVVPEIYPASYLAEMDRFHRWTRGDWQLGPWIFPFVLNKHGKLERNTLSPLGRWKLFDNIRRTLLPPALVISFLIGWTVSSVPRMWTLDIVVLIFLSTVAISLMPGKYGGGEHCGMRDIPHTLKLYVRFVLSIIFLAHTSIVASSAVVKALWRMLVSRRKMLEWRVVVSGSVGQDAPLRRYLSRMKLSLCLTIFIALLFHQFRPSALIAALPILALWFVAPLVAWWLGKTCRRALTPR